MDIYVAIPAATGGTTAVAEAKARKMFPHLTGGPAAAFEHLADLCTRGI